MIKSIITNLSAITLLLITCCSSSSDSPAPVKSNQLTLLTYNIHHGAPSNPDVINLSNIASVIKKSGAEIIALQEVDVNTERSNNVDQVKALAELLSMEYYFSKSIDYRNGEYGNAILSKYPMSNKRRFDLPMPVAGEKRSVAFATIELPDGKTIEFGSTHFDLAASRVEQAKFLNEYSKQLNKPLFIGGDYNATPESPEMIELKKEFNFSCKGPCPFTIPVNSPNKAIDFVVYNKAAQKDFTLLSGVAMNGQYASDHLPVIAVFQY